MVIDLSGKNNANISVQNGLLSGLLTLVLLLLWALPQQAEAELPDELSLASFNRPLDVLVPQDALDQYLGYLSGRSPIEVKRFDDKGANRLVVELILLHQALLKGGFNQRVNLQPVDDYKRMLAMLNQGKADMRGLSVWRQDVAMGVGRLLISTALFRDGEVEAGIYTHPDNRATLASKDIQQLRLLTAVSNHNWTVDWRTLESMGLSYLYHSARYPAMVKMVHSRRADFMLAPFPGGRDLTLYLSGLSLQPVPGIKVALQGSRHWVASRRGELAFKALEKGLIELREQGVVSRAFHEAGVFNPKVEGWRVVNP